MKKILFAIAIATSFLAIGGNVQAEGFFGLLKPKGVPDKPPHHLAPPWVCPENCPEPVEKVVKTHTRELSRKGFTKWEEHCCGIKMKGNYMKVTYETFFSDGSSVVWEKHYRS
ncbi:MAG: hypothetical protein P1U89_06925 [Verrucomicrobiales bacterium]|nr:hypothetical protein [Verrucomicrobiales bacterium]